MSDYFKNQNQGKEYGPGPNAEVLWLVVDPVNENCTKVCYVRAKNAYQARHQACIYIEDLSNNAVFYPNPMRYPSDR